MHTAGSLLPLRGVALYLLGKVGKRKAPVRMSFALRADIAKLDRYRRQFRFLYDNRIESTTELGWYAEALQNEIDILVEQRKPLYKQRRFAPEQERAEITAHIDGINAALLPLRKKWRLCNQVKQDAASIKKKADAVQALLEQPPAQNKHREKDKAPRYIM